VVTHAHSSVLFDASEMMALNAGILLVVTEMILIPPPMVMAAIIVIHVDFAIWILMLL
jgi:hypothetical protein